eukprot:g60170.t1
MVVGLRCTAQWVLRWTFWKDINDAMESFGRQVLKPGEPIWQEIWREGGQVGLRSPWGGLRTTFLGCWGLVPFPTRDEPFARSSFSRCRRSKVTEES